jgi:very-short-patch-repair endonuclease
MSRRFWTDKDLKIEAKKFQSRIEFSRKSNGAYQAALRRGLMDKICVHMSKFKWTQKTLTVEALKYPSRVAFKRGSPSAYSTACRLNIIDLVCAYCPKKITVKIADIPDLMKEWHPTKNKSLDPTEISKGADVNIWWKCKKGHEWLATAGNRTHKTGPTACPFCNNQTSKNEIRIFTELTHVFNNVRHRAKELGFEIDIFLPDLKVAIEYDGKYWHSQTEKSLFDLKKQKIFLDNQYRFIRIRERPLQKTLKHDMLIGSKKMVTKRDIDALVTWVDHTSEEVIKYTMSSEFLNEAGYNHLIALLPAPPSEKSLAMLLPKLATEWDPKNNGELTPFDFTLGSTHVVYWVCPLNQQHPAYDMPIDKRAIRGQNCPYCSGQRICAANCLAATHPKIAVHWHPFNNETTTPFDIVAGSPIEREWQCKICGYEWKRAPVLLKNQKTERYCPECRVNPSILDSPLGNTQEAVLKYIKSFPACRIVDISKGLKKNGSHVSTIVNQLIKWELISKTNKTYSSK